MHQIEYEMILDKYGNRLVPKSKKPTAKTFV